MVRPETLANQVIGPVALLVLSLGAGTGFVAARWSEPVSVVPFALVRLGLSAPVSALMVDLQAMQTSRAAADRLTTLLDTPQVLAPSQCCEPAGTRIELSGATYGYDPDDPVLEDIESRRVGHGTAIVDASGSGKSTLARLLLRYADPDARPAGRRCSRRAGDISLGGVPLREIAPEVLYRTVGAVVQDARLLRTSIAANITLAALPWRGLLAEHPGAVTQMSSAVLPTRMADLFDDLAVSLVEQGFTADGARLIVDTVIDMTIDHRWGVENLAQQVEGESRTLREQIASVWETGGEDLSPLHQVRHSMGRAIGDEPHVWFERKLDLVLDGITASRPG